MLVSPEWEEQELREQQARAREADLQPLSMTVPAWWNQWQTFLSELQQTGRADPGATFTEDDVQLVYERAWCDAVKTVEAAIRAATKGE
jgi:hypothetical protein